MKLIMNLLGGLAGAIALNVLHETMRHFDDSAPKVNVVGEEGVNKVIEAVGGTSLKGSSLYTAALSADVLSNGLYYSTIGNARKKHLVVRGVTCGLAAGIGALTLTKKVGLGDKPINRTPKTKLLTVSYYVFGGLVAALTIKALRWAKKI